jgi:raffinose/stachyose/melibiose transport system permease protein
VTTRAEQLGRHALLLFATLIVVVPFLGVLSVALQPQSANVSGLSFPRHITFDNFARAWALGHFSLVMKSSALIALVVVPVAIVGSILAGYAFATMRFPGKRLLFGCLMAGIVMPFEATVVSLYFMMNPLGLINTYWSVILPEVGLSIAFGTYWLRSAFSAVPAELVEAARVDGAASWQILLRVLLPVSRSSILTLGTLFFMWSWNEFLLALVFLQTADKVTAPAGLASFLGTYSSDIPGLCAAALMVMAPVLVVYLLTQRTFVRGLFEGAAK